MDLKLIEKTIQKVIKNDQLIKYITCKNSFFRRQVHQLAEEHGIFHTSIIRDDIKQTVHAPGAKQKCDQIMASCYNGAGCSMCGPSKCKTCPKITRSVKLVALMSHQEIEHIIQRPTRLNKDVVQIIKTFL